MSDNFHFDMTGVALDKALSVAFGDVRKATGWAEVDIDPEARSASSAWGANQSSKRLILFWAEHETATPFPGKLGAEAVEPFIKAWLTEADYGQQPDHDGDNGKGWRVYNEAWTHVANLWQAFVAIEPVWLMYGK